MRRPHGVRGEMAVELITDEPDAIFASGRRVLAGTPTGVVSKDPVTGGAIELHVTRSRPFQEGLLVTFAEIADRNVAQQWNGRYLLVPFDELTPPEEGEVFLHELAGMRVLRADGSETGTVKSWYELPQGYVLEVETNEGVRDVPYNDVFVLDVDRAARTLTVEMPDEVSE